jgi:hypothetical protein
MVLVPIYFSLWPFLCRVASTNYTAQLENCLCARSIAMATNLASGPEHATTSAVLPESNSLTTAPSESPIRTPSETALPLRKELPFRFLNLPIKLRYIVYDQIDDEVHRHELNSLPHIQLSRPLRRDSSLTLVSKTLPFALLSTSRQINFEAKPFFASKLAILQESERFHYVMETDFIRLFYGLLESTSHLSRIIIEDYNARDIAHPLRTLPKAYQVHKVSIAQGTQTYVDIQSFTKRCPTALLNKYPKTTTMAFRSRSKHTKLLRHNFLHAAETNLRLSFFGQIAIGQVAPLRCADAN